MSIWFAIPSCRRASEAEPRLARWRQQGYKLALLRQGEPINADILLPTGEYLGWAKSVNILAGHILEADPTAQWIVTGGDDYLPDLSHGAEEIGAECARHFGGTLGVMQPTGDRWGDSEMTRQMFGEDRGALLDRIAGSPWLGREWCSRAYSGRGPMWDEYWHLHSDEELQEVAVALGLFWQRRDLIQYHDHPLRKEHPSQADWPDFLRPINTPESWARHKALFDQRKRLGFPQKELLPTLEC